MKVKKALNLQGALLNLEQLKTYLESIASDHTLQEKSAKETYPIPRMLDNYSYITRVYEMLNTHLKLGINIHQAGEWLLDNYYMIEETVKEVKKELPLKKYVEFPGIASGKYQGYARCYVLASEIVSYTEGGFQAKDLEEYLRSYQNKKSLSIDEIWNISLFFKIVLMEKIREICEKIESSQIQKIKVESIIERLVENKPKDELKFVSHTKNYGENSYTFIEYMSYKLKQYGRKGIAYLNILEEEISKQGLTLQEVIKKEHFDIALKKVAIGNAVKSIRTLQRMNFAKIFETINGVEEILREDPSKVYSAMEYKTKECYRSKIQQIAKKAKVSEIYVAKKAIELAKKGNKNTKESHVGFYLIDDRNSKIIPVFKFKKRKPKRDNAKKSKKLSFSNLFHEFVIFNWVWFFSTKDN